MSLELVPVTLRGAVAIVKRWHRHSGSTRGWKFGVAVEDGGAVVGVGIAGRPVARGLQDGRTLEITRCCTDGTRNAPSKLYGALIRASWALGFRRVVTYTLATEPGSSLRAVGFQPVAQVRGRQWNTPSRRRKRRKSTPDRVRWAILRPW